MMYTIKTAGYTWTDYRIYTEIAKELNITPVLDKTQDYRRNWILRESRIRRIIKNYRPKRKRNQGTVAYPRFFFGVRGGSTNSVEDRENGDLGT